MQYVDNTSHLSKWKTQPEIAVPLRFPVCIGLNFYNEIVLYSQVRQKDAIGLAYKGGSLKIKPNALSMY